MDLSIRHLRRKPRAHSTKYRLQGVERLEEKRLLVAQLVINEVMYNPLSGQDDDEWIELFNAGDQSIHLGGHRIDDGVDFEFPNLDVPAGEFLVVAADVDRFRALYPDVENVIGGWEGRLGNRSDRIVIEAPNGDELARARYADSGDWADRRAEFHNGAWGWTWFAPHDGEGSSLELANPNMPGDVGHNWLPSEQLGGTPGVANHAAAADIAPAIFDVGHVPIIPTSNDSVSVSARVVDERPGVQVTLFYRESQLLSRPFVGVPMLDDGQHDDGAAGDQIYGASIPPFAQDAVVEFYVQSVDVSGRVRTSPAPTDEVGRQEANLLYQVDDEIRPSDAPLYRTVMTVGDRARFTDQPRGSDSQANATFIATVSGVTEARYNVGVRYRGSGSRVANPPNNRINIPGDRPWNDATRININSGFPMAQISGSALFNLAGLPVADAVPVRRLDNNVDLASGRFYAHVEVLDGTWAEKHFPNDSQGNVYRGRRAGSESPPGGRGAGLFYQGEDPLPYVSYLKMTNRSQADYSDVIRLTDVLNNTPDDVYLEEVAKHVNIDQWMRTLAVIDLTGYSEAGLLLGDAGGDDYAMYRGVDDPRFVFVPYDMDSMYSQGGSLLLAQGVPALKRLLDQPEVRALYYQHVYDLMEGVYSPERLENVLGQLLTGVASQSRINSILRYFETRFRSVRKQVPLEMTVTGTDERIDDRYHTDQPVTGTLSGTANALTTRSVEVNGEPAQWDFRTGQWTISGVTLDAGSNSLTVQAFDADGLAIDSQVVHYWREVEGAGLTIEGDLATDTRWTRADSPVRLSGTVVVPADGRLTVEAGTQIEFGANANLIVRGQLVVDGAADAPVWLTRTPGRRSTWSGLRFDQSSQQNRIQHAIIQFAEGEEGVIDLVESQLEIESVTFANSPQLRIHSVDSSLSVRGSIFTSTSDIGEAPETATTSGHIWAQGIPQDGAWEIANNQFGHTGGSNVAVEFHSSPGQAVPPLIRDNEFLGGGGLALRVVGQARVEGNRFSNYVRDSFGDAENSTGAILAQSGTIYTERNGFQNVETAVELRDGASLRSIHNTIYGTLEAAIVLRASENGAPSPSAHLEATIIDADVAFLQEDESAEITMNHSLTRSAVSAMGIGNVVGHADLDQQLLPRDGSPALGLAPAGLDAGAEVPLGALIVEMPATESSQKDVVLHVGGAGIISYRYRLNDGNWSDPFDVDRPIELTDLADGTYVIQVIGQNSFGEWQQDDEAFTTREWTVDSSLTGLRINEIMADNRGSVTYEGFSSDLIELKNAGGQSVDLGGMSITDDPTEPKKFVFPAGTVIEGHGHLVLLADQEPDGAGIHLGFALNSDGEHVYLHDATGEIIDEVGFGIQPANFSIGRDADGVWAATEPTFGDANRMRPEGSRSRLRINEWMADARVTVDDDYIEIFNPSLGPVNLGGMHLTDNIVGWPDRFEVPPLTYVADEGHLVFLADGNTEAGKNHVSFGLSRTIDTVSLADEQLRQIDGIRYWTQLPDVSSGLVEDGAYLQSPQQLPTPGFPNEANDDATPAKDQFLNLRISEIHFNPAESEDLEFIELVNLGNEPIDLTGVRISDGVDFEFPSQSLGPAERLVVVKNEAVFRSHYGDTATIAGEYERSLSNGGERISLLLPSPSSTSILSFAYDDAWYPLADGEGHSLVVIDELADREAWNDAASWNGSQFAGGSPGFPEADLSSDLFGIHEVARMDGESYVELINETQQTLDLSGWYLSDDSADLTKFRIPPGTHLTANQQIGFTSSDLGDRIVVSNQGGWIALSSPDADPTTAMVIEAQSYGATIPGGSQGRHVLSTGDFEFTELTEPTLASDADNSAPQVGPVVISEIAYAPRDGIEYVEIHNASDDDVPLHAPDDSNRPWALRGAIDFVLPAQVTIPGGGYVVIVGTDPSRFRQQHEIPQNVDVLGPFNGVLDDNGDEIRLVSPAPFTDVEYLVDRVAYSDQAPWPPASVLGDETLNRVSPTAYGNDPASWQTGLAGGTPGRANLPADGTNPTSPGNLTGQLHPDSTVQLRWEPALDAETGIVAYEILRDDQVIGQTSELSFVDDQVSAGIVTYRVRAVSGQGSTSPLSARLRLGVFGATARSIADEQILLVFDTEVTRATAENSENYQLDDVVIHRATLGGDGRTVSLVAGPLDVDRVHTLQIQNVESTGTLQLPPNYETRFARQMGVPGLTVRGRSTARARISKLADIDPLLQLPPEDPVVGRTNIGIYPNINFFDDDDHEPTGIVTNDVPFPTDTPGEDNNLVIDASGYVVVEESQAGPWTFAVNLHGSRAVPIDVPVIARESSWRYLDDGTDQRTDWRNPDFDDARWSVGTGKFGYGNGGESTLIDFGSDEQDKHVTTYFRKSFEIGDPTAINGATARLIRDDGAAVYLNGLEITRRNLVANANFDTLANSEITDLFENAPVTFSIDPALFVAGTNVMAVEIHQSSPSGADLSFDFELLLNVDGMASSDGAQFSIDGDRVIVADAGNEDPDRIATVNLTAGAHPVHLQFYEWNGGAEVELIAAPGTYQTVSETDRWQLVGNQGALRVITDPLPAIPIELLPVRPYGAGIEQRVIAGSLTGQSVPLRYELSLSQGTPISLVAQPDNPAGTLEVRIRDSLRVLATAQSPEPGEAARIPNFETPADGQFTLEVVSQTAMPMTLHVLADAYAESEPPGTATNDMATVAEPIALIARDEVAGIVRHRVSGAIDNDSLADYFVVDLEAGTNTSFTVATEAVVEGARLVLMDSDEQPIAVGIRDEDMLQIRDFPIVESGSYYLSVSGNESTAYTMSVITGASNVGANNESYDAATSLSVTGQQLGLLAGVAGRRAESGTGALPGNPTVLFDAEGFWWDLENGVIRDGTRDAFDGAFGLDVPMDMQTARFEDADREVALGPVVNADGATVSRKFFVSPDAGFVRFLEIVENQTLAPITTSLSIRSNLGANDQIDVLQTSDGDAIVTDQDAWFVFSDGKGGAQDPVVFHSVFGQHASELPESSMLVGDRLTTRFSLDLAPGEKKIVMHFAAQARDRDQALTTARWLADLPSESISGLTAMESAAIVNYTIPVNTAWYTLPLMAGEPITVTATAAAIEGGPVVQLTAFSPQGEPIAAGESTLDLVADNDGSYRLLAQAVRGAGEFVLATTPAILLTPFQVVDVSPDATVAISQTPLSVDIHTSAGALLRDATGVQLNGVPAESAEWVDGDTIRFHFDSLAVPDADQVQLTVSSTAIADYSGRPVEPYQANYEIDSTPPSITSRELLGLAYDTLAPGPFSVDVAFSEPIVFPNMTVDGVALRDAVTGEPLVVPSIARLTEEADHLTISFDHVPEGDYVLVVSDEIADRAGNRLDAELGTDERLGDGQPGGSLSLPIRFDAPAVNLNEVLVDHPRRFVDVSLGTVFGVMDHGDDIDSFTLDLEPGEIFDVTVRTVTDGVNVQMEVRDPWARAVASASTSADAPAAHVGGMAAVAGGRYVVQVSGTAGAEFQLQVAKNAILEANDATLEAPLPVSVWSLGAFSQHSVVHGDVVDGSADYFVVDAGHLAGQDVDVALSSASSGGSLAILNPNDLEVLVTSGAWNEESQIPLVLRNVPVPDDGSLLVRVDLLQAGDYQVIVSNGSLDADDDGIHLQGRAVRGHLGTESEGTIDDRDTYVVEATAGELLLWEARSTGLNSELRLALELRNEDGDVVAASDTSSFGFDTEPHVELMYRPVADNRLTLVVQRTTGEGPYEIRMTDATQNPVVGRFLFQNDSEADGNDPSAGPTDVDALERGTSALLPNVEAGQANYSTSANGINGLLVDIAGVTGPLTVDDFGLRVDNGEGLNNWASAPRPKQVLHRPGAGVGGSDRIHLVWGDHEIENTWLEVTVFANQRTGLVEPDVFYFGNLIGDTGDHVGRFEVNSIDLLGVKNHQGATYPAAMIFDTNHDGVIDALDESLVSLAQGAELNPPFGANSEPHLPAYGDTNLDGVFDRFDLELVNFDEYEDEYSGNSTWSEGDWDGDGDFTSLDLVFAFQQGRFNF